MMLGLWMDVGSDNVDVGSVSGCRVYNSVQTALNAFLKVLLLTNNLRYYLLKLPHFIYIEVLSYLLYFWPTKISASSDWNQT